MIRRRFVSNNEQPINDLQSLPAALCRFSKRTYDSLDPTGGKVDALELATAVH